MGPLWEDGGERKEGSLMYLHVVGQRERKRNTPSIHMLIIAPNPALLSTAPTISVNATTTVPAPTNSLKGVTPAIFTGDQSCGDNFLNEFQRYKLLNWNNDSMSVPFYRVLTALSYIWGPLVEDWVNSQDTWLEGCIDTTKPNHVVDKDEVLWTKFEDSFKAVWKDTAKMQNAYNQLMKLTMQNYDIDTYNATFEWLAAAAKWEPNAKGTIACYRSGLWNNIHCKILECEVWPIDMAGWEEAVQKEVNQVKEIKNAGLNRFCSNQPSCDTSQYQMNQCLNNSSHMHQNSNPNIVPMDMNSATTTLFKRLTDEERAQLWTKEWCFRCRSQGYMTCTCPKNSNRTNNSNTCESNTTTTTSEPNNTTSTTTKSATPPGPKCTITQQIHTLKESMTEEECSVYLDKQDMGEGFHYAKL